jgi:nitroreductase
MADDSYQVRYLEHQARKRRDIDRRKLPDVFRARHSQRTFNDADVTEDELDEIYEAIRLAPSSCNRQAILVLPVRTDKEKEYLDRLLVGGRHWVANANVILLLFADMIAYKSPVERGFMPYLDAGFVGESIYLAATALGVGVCYVNPNIRTEDREEFDKLFNPSLLLFCGAIALGHYDVKSPSAPKRERQELFYYRNVGKENEQRTFTKQ